MTNTLLQNRMFDELREKDIFRQAQNYTFDYLNTILDRNVYPKNQAIQNLSQFEEELPTECSSPEETLEFLNKYGAPATTATLGGRYFGFVCGSTLPIGLAAKSLATVWDQSPTLNVLSPIANKLEEIIEQWLVELFNLPVGTCAGFVSGTSMATFCGLAAARCRLLKRNNWDINKQGLYHAPKIRIVTSTHAHSTVVKAIGMLGLGLDSVEWVEVDQQGRILSDQMPELDSNTIVILQAGNVNSGSYDAFEEICKKANEARAWVHIDGAFGLWADASQELKHLTNGIQLADSWAVDGHKTLNTPYDSGIVLCKDREALTTALHMNGSYIIRSEERDGMVYTPEMSRRARVIELWAILKYLGKNGVDQLVATMHHRAKQFASEIKKIEGFTVENEVVFNQIIVKCKTEELTTRVIENIQKQRECWVGGSTWHGEKIIRVSICSWATTSDDIYRAVASFKKALDEESEK